MRVLIPILTGLGNCVMLTPLLRTLKQEFPNSQIVLFSDGRWGVEELFRDDPCISEITRNIPGNIDLVLAPRISGSIRFLAKVRAKNPKARILAQTHPVESARDWIRNTFIWVVSSQTQLQPFLHETEQDLSLLHLLEIPKARWIRTPQVNAPRPFSEVSKPYWLLQPGASNALPTPKRWPTRYWVELASTLLRRGIHVVLVGDQNEAHLGIEIENAVRPLGALGQMTNLCGKTSVPELVQWIASAETVIAADSGVAHLAGALERRLFVLWGPTSWIRSRPLGPQVNRISLSLGCAPCTGEPGKPGEAIALAQCPISNSCMTELTPERVLNGLTKRPMIDQKEAE